MTAALRRFTLSLRAGLVLFVLNVVVSCGAIPGSSPPAQTIGPRLSPNAPAQDQSPGDSPAPTEAPREDSPDSYEVLGKRYHLMDDSFRYREIGIASWYGAKFHGRLTANGEDYDMYALSAAHKTLPLPTVVRVTNLDNGAKVQVRVNDRGPFHDDRLIDLSFAAAKALGFESRGTAPVVVEAIDEINHPDRVVAQETEPPIYLQTGAFASQASAERMLGTVSRLLFGSGFDDISVDILNSSETSDDAGLYKVWVGPITSAADRDELSQMLEQGQIGKPITVQLTR